MITLPAKLDAFMKGQDLKGLKPYALLYRNKWVDESGSGDTPHYELDTANPIDISDLIVKPNTLSMTLDVNEIAQYNCNNVTLTLADTQNRFVEGTPNSYFPAGYQIYGSKVVLYYGIDRGVVPSKVSYTVVGSPTITADGLASGFSNSKYVQLPLLGSGVKDIVIKMTFTPISGDTNTRIFTNNVASETMTAINLYNNKIRGRLRINNQQYVLDTSFAPVFGTKYYTELVKKGTVMKLRVSTDNANFIENTITVPDGQINFTGTVFNIGANPAQSTTPFKGTIDLKNSYIETNGQMYFNGADFFTPEQRTALFTGMIKELPTYKPEKYQLDLKLVSPLEMLKDIEAKDFSNKVTGETLTYKSTDSDGHKIYWTSGTGVGGFSAVYANGTKLFEGVDYEVTQTSVLNFPAIVTIINSSHYNKTITADYYCWKTDLTVEQIVAGLVSLAGYNTTTEDIRDVSWVNEVRNPPQHSGIFAAIGYYQNSTYEYKYNWKPTSGGSWQKTSGGSRKHVYPNNFDFSFQLTHNVENHENMVASTTLAMGDAYNSSTVTYSNKNIGVVGVKNGLSVRMATFSVIGNNTHLLVHKISNGSATQLADVAFGSNESGGQRTFNTGTIKITKRGNNITIYRNGTQIATTTISTSMNYEWQGRYKTSSFEMKNDYALAQTWNIYDDNLVLIGSNLTNPCVVSDVNDKTVLGQTWYAVLATLTGSSSNYFLKLYFSNDASSWSAAMNYSLNTAIGRTERYLYFILGINNKPGSSFDIADCMTQFLASTLQLNLVNLTGLTVLEALQDFALITGYEFGVDRNGIFFFRPRLESTLPIYTLDHSELVKVDTVKKNFSDFFTKLTLTFAQVPLEFYANEGTKPTPVDKYGVINKEIDKPEIVNYDNPELAQAIGPQLLAAYAAFPDVIQCVGKMNLALELADIVNLERNYNLITPETASEYDKFSKQMTYYRACKITGINYNFAKNQITYTLRDVSDASNSPQYGDDMYEFVYDLPIQLGAK